MYSLLLENRMTMLYHHFFCFSWFFTLWYFRISIDVAYFTWFPSKYKSPFLAFCILCMRINMLVVRRRKRSVCKVCVYIYPHPIYCYYCHINFIFKLFFLIPKVVDIMLIAVECITDTCIYTVSFIQTVVFSHCLSASILIFFHSFFLSLSHILILWL